MTTPVPLADTSDMIGLHRVFRDACLHGPVMIRNSRLDDGDRVEAVATYIDNVLRLLHAHHETEDELMTPRLVQRATPEEAAEVERVGAQHGPVLAAIENAERAASAWRSQPAPDTAAVAAETLAALNVELIRHLDDEEQTVLPIAARYMTAPEWGEMPQHGMQTFTGDKVWLIMGLIREQMTAEQVSMMDAHMPLPVTEFWSSQGEPMFTEFVTALRR